VGAKICAVGGDADEVAAQAPVDVGHESVGHRVAALEGPGDPDVGVHDVGGYVPGRELARVAGDLDIPEAVPREVGLEHLRATRGPELIGLAGGPEIVDIQVAVGVEGLTVTQPDRLTAGAVDRQPDPAGEVLPEIDDRGAVLGRGQRNGQEGLGDPDRRTGIGHDGGVVPGPAGDLVPPSGVETGLVPSDGIEPRAPELPHQWVGVEDGAPVRLPRRVGGDRPVRPVAIAKTELGQQLGTVAVVGPAPFGIGAEVPAVPAVAEQHADGVGAGHEHARDVVGLIRDPCPVVGPTRCEDLVAHAGAVQSGFIETACGDVEPGGHEVAGHVELVAEMGDGTEAEADLVDRTRLRRRFEAQDVFVPQDPRAVHGSVPPGPSSKVATSLHADGPPSVQMRTFQK
jgi:hypothetical protein